MMIIIVLLRTAFQPFQHHNVTRVWSAALKDSLERLPKAPCESYTMEGVNVPGITFYTLLHTGIRCDYQVEFCQQSASNSPKKWQVHAALADNRQQRTTRYDCFSDTSAVSALYDSLLRVLPNSSSKKQKQRRSGWFTTWVELALTGILECESFPGIPGEQWIGFFARRLNSVDRTLTV